MENPQAGTGIGEQAEGDPEETQLLNTYSVEQLIGYIDHYAREHSGRAPRARDFDEDMTGVYPPSSVLVEKFGNWAEALLAAGFSGQRSRGRSSSKLRHYAPVMSVNEIVEMIETTSDPGAYIDHR